MALLFRRSGHPAPAPGLPYAPGSPEGLAARWVRWVAAARFDEDPIEDPTGDFGSAHQPDDIWFLAGSYGARLHRRCPVPAGRELFVPAVTYWQKGGAGELAPMPGAYGTVTVDGTPLESVPAATDQPFLVTGRRLNAVTARTRPVPVRVWGLWALVAGLAPGEHDLRIVGGMDGGTDDEQFRVEVDYRLIAALPAPQR